MERCKTCPHWKQNGVNEALGACELTSRAAHYAERRKPLAMVTMSSLTHLLTTHESFGCVMHPENGGERLPA